MIRSSMLMHWYTGYAREQVEDHILFSPSHLASREHTGLYYTGRGNGKLVFLFLFFFLWRWFLGRIGESW